MLPLKTCKTLLKSPFGKQSCTLAVLHAAAFKQKLIRSWRESGHPLRAVAELFAPTSHLLLPENSKARETWALFHQKCFDRCYGLRCFTGIKQCMTGNQVPYSASNCRFQTRSKAVGATMIPQPMRYEESSSEMAMVKPSVVRGTAGHPCPPDVTFLGVSQNDSFSSQDLVLFQCLGIEAELQEILTAHLSCLPQFSVISLGRCGGFVTIMGEKKSSKLSTYVFL